MIGVTGATGQLGQLVIKVLLKRGVKASEIVALVRSPEKAAEFSKQGIVVRKFDFESKPAELAPALADVKRLLLISANEPGKRLRQHTTVIEAVKLVSPRVIELVAYTSVLQAATSKMILAGEHKATEEVLVASGLPYLMLRHGWYTENFLGHLHAPAVMSAAGTAHFNPATRQDFAEADVAALLSNEKNKVIEMAGDESVTYDDLAAVISKVTGHTVSHKTVSEAELAGILTNAVHLPEAFAKILADSDVSMTRGELADNTKQISKLTGHPTTTLLQFFSAVVAQK